MEFLALRPVNVILITLISLFLFTSCTEEGPNLNEQGDNVFEVLEVEQKIEYNTAHYEDTIYVPVYSDLYINKFNPKNLLAATLSIRNTSLKDTLYVSSINYYDTKGDLVRKYIDNTIMINPMATVDYVVEKEDETGGSGANFLLTLSSKNRKIRPVIQAIMIGVEGNKAFAFTVDGHSLKE